MHGTLNYSLKAPVGKKVTYSLWSVAGRKVVEGQLEVGDNIQLPIPFIESGSYWMQIEGGNGSRTYPIFFIR